MKDSARVIRAVCKHNPNDGIYDSISSEALIEAPDFLRVIAKECVEVTQAVAENKPEKLQFTCATCFANITEGCFAVSLGRVLLSCQKCASVPQNNPWKMGALFLLIGLFGIFLCL